LLGLRWWWWCRIGWPFKPCWITSHSRWDGSSYTNSSAANADYTTTGHDTTTGYDHAAGNDATTDDHAAGNDAATDDAGTNHNPGADRECHGGSLTAVLNLITWLIVKRRSKCVEQQDLVI
jgi:hypothetical protein